MGEYPTPNIISLLKINNTYFDYLRVLPSFLALLELFLHGSFLELFPPSSSPLLPTSDGRECIVRERTLRVAESVL